ncbi:hypothetical protein L7F22_041584 [Adiantum nelumboides]|nr:hypothetical protein [Adiantum nelumboides]
MPTLAWISLHVMPIAVPICTCNPRFDIGPGFIPFSMRYPLQQSSIHTDRGAESTLAEPTMVQAGSALNFPLRRKSGTHEILYFATSADWSLPLLLPLPLPLPLFLQLCSLLLHNLLTNVVFDTQKLYRTPVIQKERRDISIQAKSEYQQATAPLSKSALLYWHYLIIVMFVNSCARYVPVQITRIVMFRVGLYTETCSQDLSFLAAYILFLISLI